MAPADRNEKNPGAFVKNAGGATGFKLSWGLEGIQTRFDSQRHQAIWQTTRQTPPRTLKWDGPDFACRYRAFLTPVSTLPCYIRLLQEKVVLD